ncbi:MBL fold metallo-hydrolase [Bacillus sp. FJAT-49705]|uniref:MBL fold metallo-hydrolase n=1 Tax=Cytobacillus citreus TaxID=2833586 RepID=A0ABS5NR55_9BACI|nr:MBL fold metallo-hydrolase [Cytobacillus citreus]MBS4190301.1 MBL fold metallo-hydrolase [Cytobacillus citreus]
MFFRSFFDENLAQMSYLIGCQRTGEAIVIDPARYTKPYFETAKNEGLKIVAAAETHIHADFLSGARELGVHNNANLYLSNEGDENWKYEYLDNLNYTLLKDGNEFSLGMINFKVMHTPGHTPESISFILTDKGGGSQHPMGIFTGDFVFVGDIGRPDLLEKAAGIAGTAESGARQMFHSIQKFKKLPDFLQVWPAHGAGSACGKALGAVPMSTVGYEKLNNWALRTEDEEEFVKILLSGQPEPPKYFVMMKKLNKIGPELINQEQTVQWLDVSELEKFGNETVLLDTRSASDFAKAHYQGTINIPFNKSFTNWAGWLLKYDQNIVLITSEKNVKVIKDSLHSIGLDRVVAAIEPALTLENEDRVESYGEITVQQLQEYLQDDSYYLIDVRNKSEWEEGRIAGAHHNMLGVLVDQLDELPKGKTYLMQCRSGARSAIAASLMQANGFKNVLNVKGGYLAWTKGKFPITH